jgi:hypothetical protein
MTSGSRASVGDPRVMEREAGVDENCLPRCSRTLAGAVVNMEGGSVTAVMSRATASGTSNTLFNSLEVRDLEHRPVNTEGATTL